MTKPSFHKAANCCAVIVCFVIWTLFSLTSGLDYEYTRTEHKSLRHHSPLPKLEQRQGPEIITVRVGVLLSHRYLSDFQKSQYSEVTDIMDYLAMFFSFMNTFLQKFESTALDMQFRAVEVLTLEESTESFIDYEDAEKNVIAASSLRKLNEFVRENMNRFRRADVVVFMTPCKISTSNANGVDTVHASGYTIVGGACTDNRTVIIQETPKTYEGVTTAVHEILHALGSVHDGDFAPTYLKNSPGALKCSKSDHNIMASDVFSNVDLGISVCTLEQVLAFFSSERGQCVRAHINRHQRKFDQSKVRHALLNTGTYCSKSDPQKANEDYLKQCYLGCIWEEDGMKREEYRGAPDYTPCEFDAESVTKMCLHGSCKMTTSDLYKLPKDVKKTILSSQ